MVQDLLIVVKTVRAVLASDGAYSPDRGAGFRGRGAGNSSNSSWSIGRRRRR
jgi:hypothetical protein